jgi:gliding motility-associated-like protein
MGSIRIKKLLLACFLLLGIYSNYSQVKNGFDVRYENELRGDITFIANNIVNRQSSNRSPNDPYNTTGSSSTNNDSWNMQYIDIDGDGTTFSSSSAILTVPDISCAKVRYAGLYWSAVYKVSSRQDFSQIKFKAPNGAYQDLTADEILFNGDGDSDFDYYSPYACYKDVTSIVAAMADPNGEYFVANVRASSGSSISGGVSGGWTMVVVYEDPNLPGKYITTFDGYAGIKSGASLDIPVDGFTTLPAPFPVKAKLGVATLEGDNKISGDGLSIKANSNAGFTALGNTVNPTTNFFNANITQENSIVTTRNPNSTNTLGWDVDMFTINNPTNSVIPNDETGATLRASSSQDKYDIFFTSFDVEIIEPIVNLKKTVEDIGGNDITGQGVNLGQTLDYVLAFQNVGNDDARNYTIRDVLPVNVTLDEGNFSLPTGVTYTYDATTRTVIFTIPNNLVEEDDPIYTIRMRVKVAENCFDFVDACSDQIQNLAYSTYRGRLNSNQITDDPSVYDFDGCGFATPGATNFLLDDLADCNFSRNVQLCGDSVVLNAGNGFDDYIWYRDENGNGTIDAGDTILNDGNPDNDLSTLRVTDIGTYIVDKIVADPCKGFKEILVVERFGTTQTNPIVDFFNNSNNDADPTNDVQGEIVSCSVDGSPLPKIFLCGVNDTQLISLNIADAQSMVWEQLVEGSCTDAGDDCGNKNATCTWNEVSNGSSFTANSAGKFRLVINYQNGCFSRFYFNVFQNVLDVQYNSNDIICATPGNITITNLGLGYGYQLYDIANNTIVVPYSANNGPSFTINTNGAYRVGIMQLDNVTGEPIDGSCEFTTPDIGIRDRDFQVDISTTSANCTDLGSINIQALNVEANYEYEIRIDDGSNGGQGTFLDNETAQADNNFTFENLNPGNYIVITKTDDGCLDTQNVTVDKVPDLTLSAITTTDIGCQDGVITLTATGGFPDPAYNYAIWSKNGSPLYSDVNNIPPSAYQNETTFTFGPGEEGDYVFIVVDGNNCSAQSNQVTISNNGVLNATITPADVSCSGNNDGAITIVATGGVSPYSYSLDGGINFVDTPNFVNLSPGEYQVVVRDSSSCEVTSTETITAPFPLSASAGVSRDATCDPNGAEVRITNVTGGTPTYTYSFDGGTTYGSSSIAILPAGDYTVLVKDASSCTFPMNVTVEDVPTPPTVVLTPDVSYDCEGDGTITATPNITTYDYTYMLNGVLNSPDPTSNIFPNVGPGTYTVRTNYRSQTPPTPSLLLSEDFGAGGTIPSPNTVGYQYEDQTVNPPGDNNLNINDYEYSVTSNVVAPFGTWANPIDHTTGTRASNGRYLVINIGTPSPGQVIYSKTINDVIHNQPLRVSLWMLNLLRSGTSGLDPDITIEIREIGTGNVVESIKTGSIPKNTGNSNWINRSVDLNPGTNSSLEFVIRTDMVGNGGNDIAIDDIEVYQIPEVCERFVETTVIVEPNKVFEAQITAASNASCNGASDGTITFEVSNFNAAGFEYSINGGAWTTSTSSPVTTPAVFGAGTHTINIRKVDDTTCTVAISRTITQPTAVIATANISATYTCNNGGATITASATGGTPGYEYQLEDTLGNVIGLYNFANNGSNTTFSGLAEGGYIVRARDVRGCEDDIDAAISVVAPEDLSFTATPTACYTGNNDGEIVVNVTGGNGGLLFSINNGPFEAPSPTTANTHTFNNLGAGDYIINVKDQFGCTVSAQTITIAPELSVTATAPAITACSPDTDVTISVLGGDGNYVYAIVAAGDIPADSDFSNTNPVAIATAGNYEVYVRDNGGIAGYCTDMFPITITKNDPIAITPTVTHISCFGGNNGAINLAVTGGNGPYLYSIDGGTYQPSSSFPNLTAATYVISVQDVDLCTETLNVTVNEPAVITAEAVQTTDYTCLPGGEAAITVGSIDPTTGGSGNYQYSINGGTWTASTTGGTVFTGLTDGTYSIRVRDANAVNCFITLTDIIIDPLPVAPTLSGTVDYNCDGSGDITIAPFDANYTYAIDGGTPQTGANANIFTNIAPGNHTITVDYGSECTTDIVVNVVAGREFNATITNPVNISCNGGNDGGFVINASHFGVGGFQYSINGAAFSGPFTTSQTITGLTAQVYNVEVRDVNNPAGCSVTLNQTLSEPNAITATASITAPFTCDNTGATITAVASGGTPSYTYQLETDTGTIVRAYQPSGIFTDVPANASGENYVVRVNDSRGCTNAILAAVTVNSPEAPTFGTTATACYSGNNDGTIQVDVTSIPGNGNFQFRINGGTWLNGNTTATRHIFTGLANGSYTIDVKDGYGCPAAQEIVVLNPVINAATNVVHISSCADGSITVTANGGDGLLAYAFVLAGTAITAADFGPSNTYTVPAANAGTYDVYVWDNNATDPHCEYMETVTVNPATPLTFTATPTDPECHDGPGNIAIGVTSGIAPYTYQIIDLDNGGASDATTPNVINNTKTYFNLAAGNYTINVTDATGCTVSHNATINNPEELTADIESILSDDCNPATGFRFINYPTSLNGTLQFSHDGGTTWYASDTFDAPAFTLSSGDAVFPSIRTIDGSNNTLCRVDLPRYVINYPLDDLDISISTVVKNCNELEVTVQGNEGTAPYQYTYTDDPANFNAAAPVNPWSTPARGLADPEVFGGLIPGRTYVFYVRDDNGCIRQSNQNVAELQTNPIEINAVYEPSCFGANDGEITYTLTDNVAPTGPDMRWELYDLGGNIIRSSGNGNLSALAGINVTYDATINITDLATGEYYIVITEVNGGVDSCISGSENLIIDELDPITATLNKIQDISCNSPGIINIENISGGGGSFTYTVTGPAPFTAINGTMDNPIEIPANSPAGNYNVTIQDQYGCSVDLGDVPLTLTPNPTIDSITVDNCVAPHSITVTATSTAATILYSNDGGTTYVDNGGQFDNVLPGTYNIAIMDSNGCTDTDTVTVHPMLTADVSLTKLMDCTITPDAQITIDILSGSGDNLGFAGSYDYEIVDSSSNIIVGRANVPTDPLVVNVSVADTYTITIYDNNTDPTCNRTFTVNVPAAIEPVFTETHLDVSCNGANDGSITLIETNNAINPLVYELRYDTAGYPLVNAADYSYDAATKTYSDLAPGDYVVRGIGTNECSTDLSVTITELPAIAVTVTAIAVTEFACTTGNTNEYASITVDPALVTGGTGTYVRYVFVNTNTAITVQDGPNATYIETDPIGGNYSITIYDDKGCIGVGTAVIEAYDELLTATPSISGDISCTPGNDGEVTITVTSTDNDTSKFEYSNDNGVTWQASNVFTGLDEGIHNFLVRHTDTGCELFSSIRIEDPNTFEVDIASITDVICYGTATGTATFTVTTYPGTYTWEVFNSDDTPTGITGTDADLIATGLVAGDYYVTFTQDNVPTCENRRTFSISGPDAAITADTVTTDITCNPTDNGIIEIVNAAGGWGNYTYYVGLIAPAGNYVANPKFDGLVAGTYQAWIRDNNGCELRIDDNIVLTDPTPITADLQINVENCSNFEGEIQVINVLGGQGSNYSYQLQGWDGSAYVNLRPIQTTDIFGNLGAGQYRVIVSDQWNCTAVTAPVTLYDEMIPSVEVVKLIDCTVDSGGQITISQTGGTGPFTYAVTYPDGITIASNATGVFTGLDQVGEYTFTITDDSTHCSETIRHTLADAIQPPTPTIEAVTNVTCFGADNGTISVSVLDNGIDPYIFQIIDRDGTAVTIDPTSFNNTSAVFTGLANTTGAGYTIRVTAANGCFTTATQTISQPIAALAVGTPLVSEFNCTTGNATNYAIIDLSGRVSGGSENYVRYVFVNNDTGITVQDGSNPDYTELDLAGGNYTITVYDDMGCSDTTTAAILPFVGISDPDVTINNGVSCNGNDEDITVNVTTTLGAPAAVANLEFAITSPNTAYTAPNNATGIFTGLGVGNYVITITNLNTGCIITTTHTVNDPKVIEVTAIKTTDETCLNDSVNGGSFSVDIANYTGGYNYQVFLANGTPYSGILSGNTATPLVIDNLLGGSYYVQITETDLNSTFCSDTSNAVTILSPEAPITAVVSEESNVSCDNDKGSILVDPSGGKGPYTITIASATQTVTQAGVYAYLFNDLSAGTFNVTVIDALGCSFVDTITLIEPDPILASISPDVELTCYGDSDGVVFATVNSGGLGTIRYRLNVYDPTGTVIMETSAPQLGNTFGNLSSGIYSITVTDEGNCGMETQKAIISDPNDVVGTLIRTRALSCTLDAQLELTASGGTGPYKYSLDGITYFPMTEGNNDRMTFTVPAGTYRYYVQDDFGCGSILSNEIKEDAIAPLTITMDTSAAVINCNGDNTAILIAKADGGLGNYRYELFTDAALTNSIAGPQINGQFSNLTMGSYWVRATSDDCVVVSNENTITEPTPLVVDDSFTDVTCNGANDGSISVSLTGGSGGYQYAISPDLDKFDTVNTFTDLAPGNYTVIAQDINGCFEQLRYTITEPAIITAVPTTTPEICIGSEDGTISLTISGGTAPYRTSINSTTDSDFVLDRTLFTDLAAGTYAVFVKDAQDCMINMAVTIDPGVNLNATATPIYECTGNIPNNSIDLVLEDATVAPNVMYALDSTDPNDMVLEPNFTNIAPGNHYIAIAHANGCVFTIDFEIENFEPLVLTLTQGNINEITAVATGGQQEYTFYFNDKDNGTDNTHYITETKTHQVRVVDQNGCEAIAEIFMEFIDIEIPNFFTPDADGQNDFWRPRNQEGFPKILTIIFDRYGREVYRMGLNDQGWDGMYHNTELPTGDYWYIIKLRGEEDDREFVGHFTLYR